MRRLLLLAVPGAALLALAVGMTALTAVTPLPPAAGDTGGGCLPTLAGAPGGGAGDVGALTPEQRTHAAAIIAGGRRQHLPPRAWQVALQAAQTESNLRNVDHGDRDSLGLFQMRPSAGWGSPEQLLDVNYEISTFYAHLVAVPGWQAMPPGEAAQAVEQSGFPERYQRAEALAAALVAGAGQDPSGCEHLPPAPQLAQTVLGFGQQQVGKPYVWGATGPNAWDCSSLTQAAYRAAGIALPRTSREQVAAGQHVPLAHAQPGDLVFWASARNPRYVHHVGLYLGNNQVLHAPEPGQTVTTRPLWDGGQLLPEVTRPVPTAAA